MQLQSGIQTFGEKYGLNAKHIYRLQICCEELIYELLAHCYPNEGPIVMHLHVSYAESDHTVQISLDCGGLQYDPFTQEDDGLGVTILKKMSEKISYRYENAQNQIRLIFLRH